MAEGEHQSGIGKREEGISGKNKNNSNNGKWGKKVKFPGITALSTLHRSDLDPTNTVK